MRADTNKTQKRFNRIAPFFNALEGFFEGWLFKSRRKVLWSKLNGEHILEVGVGTGKNFKYYPVGKHITALDFSREMLRQAKKKRRRDKIDVELVFMDVESLCYADNSFDTIIASFVFCSVPHPVKGLQELYRVCRPGGQVLLLEHVVSSNPVKAFIMKFFNPIISFITGANINRDTVKLVKACGFENVNIDPSSSDVVKLIQAIK